DGGIFSYGDAEFYGSVGATTLSAPIVGIASGSGDAIPATPTAPTSIVGYDLSWPQCGGLWPSPPYGFGIVGVTGGHLFSANPCLRAQWRWATDHGSFAGLYLNTNSFTTDELAAFLAGPALSCKGSLACAYHEWGRLGADAALKAAKDLGAPMWWLDVETGNVWSPDTNANAFLLQGMIDELRAHGKRVGIYSTAQQFGEVVGGYAPGLPTWVAGADPGSPAAWCSGRSFGGGPTWMVQDLGGAFDVDVLCSGGVSSYKVSFAVPRKLTVPTYAHPTPPAAKTPDHDPMPLLGVSGDALVKASGAILEARPHVPAWIKAGGAVVVFAFLGWHGRRHHRRPAQPSR
ncbi:MAG TPA: hypothetical protein VNY84_04920, partial [Acidimicrobiales bacterium]|nr:hypothetical protein [Acidimicrobiales bacterium]